MKERNWKYSEKLLLHNTQTTSLRERVKKWKNLSGLSDFS